MNDYKRQQQLEGLVEKIFIARKQADIAEEEARVLRKTNEHLIQTMSADTALIRELQAKIIDLKDQLHNGVY